MSSNYDIVNSVLTLCDNKTITEIDYIAKNIVMNNVHRAKTILNMLQSKQAMNKNNITIISADEISITQKNNLAQVLKTNKDNITFSINTNLIAGIIIKIGDQIIDNSVATRIANMHNLLANTNVN